MHGFTLNKTYTTSMHLRFNDLYRWILISKHVCSSTTYTMISSLHKYTYLIKQQYITTTRRNSDIKLTVCSGSKYTGKHYDQSQGLLHH